MNWSIYAIFCLYSAYSKVHNPLLIKRPSGPLPRRLPFTTLAEFPPIPGHPQFIRQSSSQRNRQNDGPDQQDYSFNPNDAVMDYSYMTKDRRPRTNQPNAQEEAGTEEEQNAPPAEMAKNQIANQSQAGTFGENSGNMSNNTNSNNTTTNNHYHKAEPGPAPPPNTVESTRPKDDVPLGAMQSPTTNNLNNQTGIYLFNLDQLSFTV